MQFEMLAVSDHDTAPERGTSEGSRQIHTFLWQLRELELGHYRQQYPSCQILQP